MAEIFAKIENLKAFLFAEGIKGVQLAQLLGVTTAQASRIVNNLSPLNERHLYKLIEAYPRLNVEWLKGGGGEMWLPETVAEMEEGAAVRLVSESEALLMQYIKEQKAAGAGDEVVEALYVLLGRVQASKIK